MSVPPSFMQQLTNGLDSSIYSPLMGIAAGLFNAGAASRLPVSTGQAIGQGMLGGQQFQQAGLQNQMQQLGLARGQNQLSFMGALGNYMNQLQSNPQQGQAPQQLSPTDLQNMGMLSGLAGIPSAPFTSAASQRLQYAPVQTLTPDQANGVIPGGVAPGQVAQQNTATGKITTAGTSPIQSVHGYDEAGYPITTLIDTRTGQVLKTSRDTATSSASQPSSPTAQSGGPASAENLPNLSGAASRVNQQNQMVDLIGQYKTEPSSYMLRSPAGIALMAKVQAKYPEYDAKNYQPAQKTLNDFTSGPSSMAVKSFNVALQHLGVLDQLSVGLNNGDTRSINSLKNMAKTQLGVASPTAFDAAKQLVADEIQKAVAGVPGGEGEREGLMENISSASSPQQLQAVIGTFKQLMAGQLNGLQQKYEAGTNRDDFQSRFLSPQSRAIYQKYEQQTPAQPTAQQLGVPNAPGIPKTAQPQLPPAALAALKEGQHVKFSNGQVWTLVNGQPQRIQ